MIIGIDGRYAQGDLLGIGNYIKNLVKGLSGKGFECVIFYSAKPKLKIKDARSVVLTTSNRYLFEQVLLPISLIKNKIDIYHATGNSGTPILTFVPIVLTIHDIIPLDFKGYFNSSRFPFLSRNLFRLNMRLSCYKSSKIITVSKLVKKEIVNTFMISSKKIDVIYSGVSLGKIGKLPHGLHGKNYLLNHGGIDVRKNLENTIRAFSKVKLSFPNYKLVITGENKELKPKLKYLVNELKINKSVVFTGYVSNDTLYSLIKNAKCICYPSYMEGFGMPILEGFIVGIPVVTSNVTSLPEIANNAALLVNPKNFNQLASAIISVLNNKRKSERMIKLGKIIAKKFNWNITINKTLEIYKDILN